MGRFSVRRVYARRVSVRGITSLLAALVLGLVLESPALSAEAETSRQASAEERAVAADLFKQAAAARERGEWASCEHHLEEAIAIVETPGLRFHLAYCKEQQQRWVEALVDYRRAGEMLAAGNAAPDVEELLPSAIERLEADLPRLTLIAEGVPEGATLYFDGDARSTKLFGKAVPLDPGNRRVEVVAEGFEVFARQVTLLPGERRELQVVLVEKEPKSGAAMAKTPKPALLEARDGPARSEPFLSAKGYVMLSEALVSAAGLGIGIGFSVEADTHETDRQTITQTIGDPSACAADPPHRLCDRLQQASRDADTASNFATAAYITSAVGVAALVVTWLVWPDAEGSEVDASAHQSQDFALNVDPTSDGVTATLHGRF